MTRKNKSVFNIDCLDMEEEMENGFSEAGIDISNALCTFNFASESDQSASPVTKTFEFNKEKAFEFNKAASPKSFEFNKAAAPADALADNRKTKTEPSIATPSIEGEVYTIGRYYKLRYTTAKMLNEIKATHHDVNVYMNTIVDEAIRYYYTFGCKKDDNTKQQHA